MTDKERCDQREFYEGPSLTADLTAYLAKRNGRKWMPMNGAECSRSNRSEQSMNDKGHYQSQMEGD